MKLVLLSGGSGKRLWPLSNDSRSKQFLKVLCDPDNKAESMVQRVWRQLAEAELQHKAFIATGKGQMEVLQGQLGYHVPIIVEPERRDTYPAIALAATYLYSIVGVPLNEVIAILPVDPYVEDHFFEKVKELESVIRTTDADLALIGVKPTYPSAKYGYIIPESDGVICTQEKHLPVSHFTEKPSEEKAKELLEQNALWNCGVFAFKLDFLINHLISYNLPIRYEELLKQYYRLPKISFDYQVVEKARNVVVTPYDGTWSDLGTWNTLTKEIQASVTGKGTISEDSVNTHLINELNIPITVLGVSNAIVAASPDGILVSDKAASPRIKDVMKQSDSRPMYEERRWGHYRVLDFMKCDGGQDVLTQRICIEPGKNLSYHFHLRRKEVWTVVSGEGEMILDDEVRSIKKGDVLVIPLRSKHSLRAITRMEIIEVQTGSELVEEDVYQLATDWSVAVQVATTISNATKTTIRSIARSAMK